MFSCNACPMTSPLNPSIHQLKISFIHICSNDFWIHKGAFTFTFTTISALPCDQVCSVFTHHRFVLPLLHIQQTSLVKLHCVFSWASETSNCFWLASLVLWRGLDNNFERLNCPKKLVEVNFSKVPFLEMWLDLANHLHLQRHIYESSEFSVQLDWGFIHTMWEMGSWKWEWILLLELFSQAVVK
jgi:hypothetical protein